MINLCAEAAPNKNCICLHPSRFRSFAIAKSSLFSPQNKSTTFTSAWTHAHSGWWDKAFFYPFRQDLSSGVELLLSRHVKLLSCSAPLEYRLNNFFLFGDKNPGMCAVSRQRQEGTYCSSRGESIRANVSLMIPSWSRTTSTESATSICRRAKSHSDIETFG